MFFGVELHDSEAELGVTATGQGDGGERGALQRRAPADLGGRERERESRGARGGEERTREGESIGVAWRRGGSPGR